MISYDNFEKALRNLQSQHLNYQQLEEDLPDFIGEAMHESIIQRFEICWDCLWKVLKRYLQDELALPNVPNSPNPVLRLANENMLLPTAIETWLLYARARINTSHDYSGEKAQTTFALIEDFIDDAIALYQTLSKETWA